MDKLYTTREAAEILGYSMEAMRKSRKPNGRLAGSSPPKHIKLGSRVRYEQSALDAWITKNTKG